MAPELTAAIAHAIDPARARASIDRIESAWPESAVPLREVLHSFGDALPALLHLFSISPISATKIVRDPGALTWLAAPEIRDAGRGVLRMRRALQDLGWQRPGESGAAVKLEAFSILRKWKQRETLRIAFRDVAALSDVEDTTQQLSAIAEICMREVSEAWLADHIRRLGDPATPHVVLGMGKFGAAELNFSSDIDVIFFYGEAGELASGLSRQEFFTRFTQKVIETFAASDPAGPLFRIDVRLRPEGDSGPLTRSLDSMEDYYAAYGETWERMALSKSRVVAGDEELGYEFWQRLQAFIYPRVVGADMIEEIAQIKGRIERELPGATRVHRDVKLGRGGIREIEFTCQALQILHGARHAFLQQRQTLRALAGLHQLGLLGLRETETLAQAYRFLRCVEHRLQIENEAQTHTIPENGEGLRRLACSLISATELPSGDETETFLITLIRHMDGARSIFEQITQARVEPESGPPDLHFFADPIAAQSALTELGGGTGRARVAPRTKRVFQRLEPYLLHWLSQVADPDAALTRFARFTERYGARGALFETVLVNPRVLELLVKLFDASPFLSEIAIQRPQLVEEVARLGDLGAPTPRAEHIAALARNDERLPWQSWVRVYRRAQQLRIGLRDLLGFARLTEVWTECSALAEACLVFTAQQIGVSDRLTTIALGKFGGCELGYGADLDVLFIGSDLPAAAALVREMNQVTPDGRIFPVDVRLRPEGTSGQMAVTKDAWVDYFMRGRGHFWEAQALTKARPIDGPQRDAWLEAAQKIWREHGRSPDLRKNVHSMLQRVAEHRGGDPMLDFKTGPGGLMQLEFYVQALQMHTGHWEPNTLQALAAVVPRETAVPLREAYLFLRRIETVLRRMHDTPTSRIPADEKEQLRLAKRCGFGDVAALRQENRRMREQIARLARLT